MIWTTIIREIAEEMSNISIHPETIGIETDFKLEAIHGTGNGCAAVTGQVVPPL
jgi:hypothetical protein